MFPTVQQPEIKDGVSSDKEKIKLANALRRATNMVSQSRVQLTTAATATYTAIWTSDEMPEGSVWSIEAYVFYRAAAGASSCARYWRTALFFRDPAGVVTQLGATGNVATPIFAIVAFDARFAIVGNTIGVQVLDDGAATADWDATITAREVT